MIKIDKDSNLLWAYPAACHHDVYEMQDGRLFVLTREERVVPEIDADEVLWEDFIVVLDADGHELRKVSLLEAFRRSPFGIFLDRGLFLPDVFHTNTIEVLDGRLAAQCPAFRRATCWSRCAIGCGRRRGHGRGSGRVGAAGSLA